MDLNQTPNPASSSKIATPRRTPVQREEMAANLAAKASSALHAASPRLITSMLRHCSTLSPVLHAKLICRLKPFSLRMSNYFSTDSRSADLSPSNVWQYTRSIQNECTATDQAIDNWIFVAGLRKTPEYPQEILGSLKPFLSLGRKIPRDGSAKGSPVLFLLELLLPDDVDLVQQASDFLSDSSTLSFCAFFASSLIIELLLIHGDFPADSLTPTSPFSRELFGWNDSAAIGGIPAIKPLSPENLDALTQSVKKLGLQRLQASLGSTVPSDSPTPTGKSSRILPLSPIPCLLSSFAVDSPTQGAIPAALVVNPSVTVSQRAALFIPRAVPDSDDLAAFHQFGATAVEETLQVYLMACNYASSAAYEVMLVLFLTRWTRTKPRPAEMTQWRYEPGGLMIASVSGLFYCFSLAQETVNSAGYVKKGLANPSYKCSVFNPSDHPSLLVRAATINFAYRFVFTWEIFCAFMRTEIRCAFNLASDFNLVQGSNTSRGNALELYRALMEQQHSTLFGCGNPSLDPLKIVKYYLLFTFHLASWGIAFARGDLSILHRTFDTRFESYQQSLVLCRSTESHRVAVFKDALLYLNHRCPECYRPGGCNVYCRYCPSITAPAVKSSSTTSRSASRHTIPAAAEARYQLARKANHRLQRVPWAAAQQPPVLVTTTMATEPSAPTFTRSNLSYVAEHQHLVLDHELLDLGHF